MSIWEDNIYSQKKQLNKYPYDSVVSFIFRNFSNLSFEERKNIKILEVGCGAGNNISFLAKEGFDTYGIDISPSAIKFAKNMIKENNLNAELAVASFTSLPFKSNYFDVIIDRLAVTHCPDFIDDSLVEIKRVMNDNCKFFSIFFNTDHRGYTNSKDIENNIINKFGIKQVINDYLSLAPTYFMDDNETILKKYFKIIDKVKITREFSNIKHSETQFILIK